MKSIYRILINGVVRSLPETRCFGLKRFLYRQLGCVIGKNVKICSSVKIFCTGELIIGDYVWVGPETIITSSWGGKIIIEDYVRIGMRVIVVNGFHEITPEGNCIIDGKDTVADILIKKGAAINTMSIILPGKTVGEMAHIAPGSVVTKDVAPFAMVAGVPARFIKSLKDTER